MLKLTRRDPLQRLPRILASLDLGILPTTSLPFTNDLIMYHNHSDRSDRIAGDDGGNFTGHETVVGATERQAHEAVEVCLCISVRIAVVDE